MEIRYGRTQTSFGRLKRLKSSPAIQGSWSDDAMEIYALSMGDKSGSNPEETADISCGAVKGQV